jgi:predicted metalloenzyme YecM
MSLESFYQDGEKLLSLVDDFAQTHALIGVAQTDHIGYKCESTASFEALRRLLEPESHFVYQSYISGRRIAVIKLKRPWQCELGSISVLELADQKPDGLQTGRFDHVEIYPIELEYQAFAKHLEDQGVALNTVERPHHTTYDINILGGYNIKLTQEPLVEKIKRNEMV